MIQLRRVLSSFKALPRRLSRNTSAATRLSLVAVVVSLSCLVITSLIGLQRGSELAEQSLRNRLTALAASRSDEVERYIESIERATLSQAISPSTADAIDEFGSAFDELDAQQPSPDETTALVEYYSDTVAPQLAAVRGRPVSTDSLVPSSSGAVQIQTNYVVPFTGDERVVIADAGDASAWTEIHRSLHPTFSEFVIQNGVADYYLIEPSENTIVYSTSKDIDVGTSLLTGPQSGTALASLINSMPRRPEGATVAIADFTPYAPAGDEPSAFVASPVVVDDVLHGYVALRLGADQLSAITTNSGAWTELGLTGETYVVAADHRMRTDARGFIEDQDAYLQAAIESGTATDDEARAMAELDTTALLQQIPEVTVDAALAGDPGLLETTNYLGARVLSAYRALDLEGLDWALFAEIERREFREPIETFVRNLLIAIAVLIIAITFLAVWWSDRLIAPLRIIATRLRGVRDGGDIASVADDDALPARSPQEFVDLAADIDTMLATLARRTAEAEARVAERRELLHRTIPSHVVDRAEAGERDVLDQVSDATVAVVLVRGLGELLSTGSSETARELLDRFVDEADDLAKEHGLDRVRLTGDAYFAACGTTRPHHDHARRAAAFVLDALDLVHEIAAEGDAHPLSMSAGLDSGPLTIGLTGGARLVFDSWGPPMQGAAELARNARSGELLASRRTRSQLPSTVVTHEVTQDHGRPEDPTEASCLVGAVVVTAMQTEREPIR